MNNEELKKLFDELPENLKKDAYRWGLSDSVVRDKIYVWYNENK